MKSLAIVALLLTLVALASAADVILVTNQNYPDSAVASVIAQKYGMAVAVIDGLNISQEEINTIKSYNPENIYIIGGPAVISEEVENTLKQNFPNTNIQRIFGITKFGTSCEAAKFAFNQSFEAIVVVDRGDYPPDKGYYKRVMIASKLASIKGIPILITPERNLSAEVAETLKQLNVKRVLLIGKDDNVANQLKELGIEVINYKDEDAEKELEKESKNKSVPLLIICTRNALDSNSASFVAGHVLFVKNESEVNISLVKEYKRVFVLGYPECSRKVAEYLNSQGVKTEVVSGKANEISNKIREKIKDEIEKVWKEKVEERKKLIVKEKAEEALEKAKNLLAKLIIYGNCSKEINITKLNETIEEAEKSFNEGNYGKAFELAHSVISKVKSCLWSCRNEIDIDEVIREKERVAFKDYIKKLIERIKECKIVAPILPSIGTEKLWIACEIEKRKERLPLPLPVKEIIERQKKEVETKISEVRKCNKDEDCICFNGCGCMNKNYVVGIFCPQVVTACQVGKEVCKCINNVCQGVQPS